MATSGSKSVTVTANDTLKFSWSQSSQSITNNTTTISWKLQLITDAYGRISSTASKSWSVTVNGKKYSGTNTVGISNSSTKTLASGTTTIAHNSDGTKTFSYSFSQQFAITFSGTYIGTKSGSGTGTLNTIPRASSFGTITGNTIGSGITININRNSTSFTHTLWYSFGSLTWQGIGSSIGTSATFTPPLSICSQVPSSTSGTMTLILRTYNGTTQIGSDVYKTITVYVPSSVVPSISGVTISEANTSVVPSSWGVYVQNKTKLKFVTSATAGTGSSIASVTVSINGKSYSGTTATTDIITASGNLTATITAKDLRGRSASTTKTVTIQAYSNPYISNFTIIRCDSSGNASEAGSYAKVTFVGGRSSVSSKNTGSYSFQYKKSTASSYTTYNFSVTSSTINTSVILSDIDTNYSYSFIGIAKDYFTSIKTAAKTLSNAFVTVDYLNGGHGIAFGKVAETSNLFDVNFKSRFRNISYLDYGFISHYANAGSGSDGYIKFCSIQITSTYQNSPIEIKCYRRGDARSVILTLRFTNSDTTDPTVSRFDYRGASCSAYIVKTATSTWDLYMKKLESYDSMSFSISYNFHHMSGVNIQWTNEYASSVPTGYITVTNAGYLPLSGGTLTGNLYTKGIILPNEGSTSEPANRLMGTTTSGTLYHLVSLSSGDNCLFGYGTYLAESGSSNYYGNLIYLRAKSNIMIDGVSATVLGTTTSYSPNVYLGVAGHVGLKSAALGSYWAESSAHEAITRYTDGLMLGVGCAGSNSYATSVNIRSMSCDFRGTTKWSSDKNLKKDIVPFNDAMEGFYDKLKPVSYKYILGNSGRPHSGFIAQEVEQALIDVGLTTSDFAGITIDEIKHRETEEDENGNVKDIYNSEYNYLLDNGISKKYDLAYNEFVALNTWQIQKLKTKVNDLELKYNDLLEKYNKLTENDN